MPGALVGVLGCFRNAAVSKTLCSKKVSKAKAATGSKHQLAELLSTYLCLAAEQDQEVLVQQQHVA